MRDCAASTSVFRARRQRRIYLSANNPVSFPARDPVTAITREHSTLRADPGRSRPNRDANNIPAKYLLHPADISPKYHRLVVPSRDSSSALNTSLSLSLSVLLLLAEVARHLHSEESLPRLPRISCLRRKYSFQLSQLSRISRMSRRAILLPFFNLVESLSKDAPRRPMSFPRRR